MVIRYTQPFLSGKELEYVNEAVVSGRLSGNGVFTKRCHQLLEDMLGCPKALLTNSCTAALEMAALLLNIEEGDEVIMPSFTFVSTANAFVLRGAVPVFVDIDPVNFNIDEQEIEKAITPKTKAIVVVHYAGVLCKMSEIVSLAHAHGVAVIEDAAQSLMSNLDGQAAATFADFSAISFHETKNIVSGEGGALIINNEKYIQRAEIIWEKGTNRSQFVRGEVDKYTWIDIGSSFLPSEITAAFLLAQLESAVFITRSRHHLWQSYHERLSPLEDKNLVQLPKIDDSIEHNAHIFFLLVKDIPQRSELLKALADSGVSAVHHYIPLHSSPAGLKYGRAEGKLENTEIVASSIVRLPLWVGMSENIQQAIIKTIYQFFGLPPLKEK